LEPEIICTMVVVVVMIMLQDKSPAAKKLENS
jgi:hypothetical protein